MATSVRSHFQRLSINRLLLFALLALSIDILLSPLAAMLLPATHSLSRKRSRSNTLGDEGLRPHCDLSTAHPTLDISNDVFRSLDIRFKKSKPEGVLENAIANGNIPHGDIATNHSTEGSRARNEDLTDEGIDDDFTDEGLTDEGIADDESTCSTKPIEPGDIKTESLWGREYPINEW